MTPLSKTDPEKLANAIRELDRISPIKTRIVSSEEDFNALVAEMATTGHRVACISNAGLLEPKRRITFLPESAFMREPREEGAVHDIDGPPRTRKPPRDVREFLAEIEAEAESAGKTHDLSYPPDGGLPAQKRDPGEAQSAFVTLARHCGLLPSASEPEPHS